MDYFDKYIEDQFVADGGVLPEKESSRSPGCYKSEKLYVVPIVDCEYSDKLDGCCTHDKNITPECHVHCCPRLSKEIKHDL